MHGIMWIKGDFSIARMHTKFQKGKLVTLRVKFVPAICSPGPSLPTAVGEETAAAAVAADELCGTVGGGRTAG